MTRMATSSNRLLLASVHDVSPRFETQVDQLIGLLSAHVGDRIALLVVPNHWGDAPIVPGSPFAAKLRGWAEAGLEIFLHGYFHRDLASHQGTADRMRAKLMTAGEGEFLGLSRDSASARIAEGRALLEDVTGRPVAGFVAPAWLYSRGAMEALADGALPIAEDHLRVWSPATGRQLARGPVITWASRSPWRLASSLAAAAALRRAPMEVLRVGVHPPDTAHPRIMRSIEKTLDFAVRRRLPGSYGSLVEA